jgi:glycosyltransferase involved in cell wall biosynthesis
MTEPMGNSAVPQLENAPVKTATESRGTESRPLRVLHVISVETSNYFLNNLFDYSAKDELEFFFVTFGAAGSFVDDLRRRGATAYALNALRRSSYPKAARDLSRIIRQHQIDIIHTHLFDPTFIGAVMAMLHGRKMIVTRHHSDAVHLIPENVKRGLYLSAERFVNKHADHIIAPSRMVRDILVQREGVPAEKVSVIPYGQTTARFEAVTPAEIARVKAELGASDHLTLVCNSRLYDRKGHVYLFEALAPLIRDGLKAKLYLVGTGDYKSQLELLVQKFGLQDHVRFLGWRDDALAIMAAADIIVHPSCEDALSSAVIESLMLEKSIIATDISGVRDSLDDGKYGLIVPPADPVAFRAALEEVIAHPEEARERARLGRKHILEYMDAGRVARAYAECYRTIAPNLG